MSATRILGLILIVGGLLILVYGGFTYTKTTHDAHIGSLELTVKKQEHVNVPLWVGAAATVLGAILLLTGKTTP